MSEPTDQDIEKFIPFLKQTNPHLNDEQLRDLARKMLGQKISPSQNNDKPLSEMDSNETESP